jgi:hypothetical protein
MQHTTARARATLHPEGVVLAAPWHATKTPLLVERLKLTIPAAKREYRPDTKEWWAAIPYDSVALGIFLGLWPGAQVLRAGERRSAPPPPRRPLAREHHFAALHLLPSAPPAVVNAAYRALVKAHHPDLLPAPEKDRAHRRMVEINGAYEALQAEGAA